MAATSRSLQRGPEQPEPPAKQPAAAFTASAAFTTPVAAATAIAAAATTLPTPTDSTLPTVTPLMRAQPAFAQPELASAHHAYAPPAYPHEPALAQRQRYLATHLGMQPPAPTVRFGSFDPVDLYSLQQQLFNTALQTLMMNALSSGGIAPGTWASACTPLSG